MQFVQEIDDLISHDNSPPWNECAAIGGFPQGITQVPETGQQTWRHDARLEVQPKTPKTQPGQLQSRSRQ